MSVSSKLPMIHGLLLPLLTGSAGTSPPSNSRANQFMKFPLPQHEHLAGEDNMSTRSRKRRVEHTDNWERLLSLFE
jgi:hypothetical protein